MNNLMLNQWYGISMYDGGFHFFIRVEEHIVYLDTFGDCSMLFHLVSGNLRGIGSWLNDPDWFESEVLKYITKDEYQLFSVNHGSECGSFIELSVRAGDIFENAMESCWKEEVLCTRF